MSSLSRRSLVTSAAALPALAVPAVAEEVVPSSSWPKVERVVFSVAEGDTSRAGEVARAEYIVAILSERHIDEGWRESFDRERAVRFIECVRTYDEDDGACPMFQEVLAWMHEHGQCITWLFQGDPGGMIVAGAYNAEN